MSADEDAREGLLQAFGAEGIASERIAFGGRTSRREYLERYGRIDIGLDTFPYAGATTTLDAAWMGVPVVTLWGTSCWQRAGTCVTMNLGLPELVARSEDEFVDAAVNLARDVGRLRELRVTLRARLEASPARDAPRFVKNLEALYRQAWRSYCALSDSSAIEPA